MTHPTLLILGALSSATLSVPFAHAAPQESGATEEASACQCTCPACLAKHGAKASAAADAVSAEMDAVKDALAAVEAEMTREERVAAVLETQLEEVDALVLGEPIMVDVEIVDEPIVIDVEIADVGVDAAASPPIRTWKLDLTEAAEPTPSDQGYLGVELGDGDDGVEIARVMPGSPAMEGGVQAGDIIFSIAGTTVMDLAGLRAAMQRFKAGDTIGFGVMRNGRPINLSAKLVELSAAGVAPVPQVEGRLRVLPAVPPAPPVPKSLERIRLLPNPEEEPEEEPEEIEVILAEPIRLPTRVVEPRDMATLDRKVQVRRRVQPPKARDQAEDALPEGYVEIMTRRERRPAEAAALQARIDALEADVAELSMMLAEIRRELGRRNPR